MPYALCPMPYAQSYLIFRSKGYIFLRTREAEPLDIGSQARAWERVEKEYFTVSFSQNLYRDWLKAYKDSFRVAIANSRYPNPDR